MDRELVVCLLRFGETCDDLLAAMVLADLSHYKENDQAHPHHIVIVTTDSQAKERAEALGKLYQSDQFEVLYDDSDSNSWAFDADYPDSHHRAWQPPTSSFKAGPGYAELPTKTHCQPVGQRLAELVAKYSPERPARVCICGPLVTHRLIPKALTANVRWYVTASDRNLLPNPSILVEFEQRLAQANQVARMVDWSDRKQSFVPFQPEDVAEPVQKLVASEFCRMLGALSESQGWIEFNALDVMTVSLALFERPHGPNYTMIRGNFDENLAFTKDDSRSLARLEFHFLPYGHPTFLSLVCMSRAIGFRLEDD